MKSDSATRMGCKHEVKSLGAKSIKEEDRELFNINVFWGSEWITENNLEYTVARTNKATK